MNVFRNVMMVSALLVGAFLSTASAATVDIALTSFARVQASNAIAQRDALIGPGPELSEDFETGFTLCKRSSSNSCSAGTIVPSQLGSFTGSGGASTAGSSQVAPKNKIVVRASDRDVYGR